MDYLFIGVATGIMCSIVFFILGIAYWEESPKNVLFHFLSMLFSIETTLLFMSADLTWGFVMRWPFLLLFMANLAIVALGVWQSWELKAKAKRDARFDV